MYDIRVFRLLHRLWRLICSKSRLANVLFTALKHSLNEIVLHFDSVHHSRKALLSACGKNTLKIRYSKRWRDNCFTTSQECGKQWIVWRLQFHAPTALLLAAVKELTFRNNLPLTRLITVSSVQPNSWILEKHWWRKIIKHNWMFY